MLNKICVIGQVDKKFIACVIQVDSQTFNDTIELNWNYKNVLVVVDQHAAHERVKIGLV